MQTEYKYLAIKVQQRPSAEPFYIVSGKAKDITKWADVPRVKDTFKVGYQRELDEDRAKKVTNFLVQDSKNIMPGSILISVNKNSIEINEIDKDKNLYEITINITQSDIKTQVTNLERELYTRLSDEEKDFVNKKYANDQEENFEDSGNDNDLAAKSYLSKIVYELKNYDMLDSKRQQEIEGYVNSISKPGLILDGQHRVFGAKEVSGDFNLPLVILPGLSSSEQVFHFYIINNKAIPIKSTQLRSVISTSLSSSEIDNLYTRFRKSGINTEESIWTTRINEDTNSPFYNLVDFGYEDSVGIIPENVMFQVAKQFLQTLPKKYKQLFEENKEWNNDKDYTHRLNMFYTLWSTIKSIYPNAWQNCIDTKKTKNILMKVSLIVLQDFIFGKFEGNIAFSKMYQAPLAFDTEETLREQIRVILGDLPEEFFMKEWAAKSLDTPEGQNLLKEQIILAISNKGKHLGKMVLFREKK
jgi:hypothetical protein